MQKFNASRFFVAATNLRGMHRIGTDRDPEEYLSSEEKSIATKYIKDLESALAEVLAPTTATAVHELNEYFNKNEDVSYIFFRNFVTEIENTLRRELSRVYLYTLTPDENNSYENTLNWFANDGTINLVGLTENISEAGKCYALGRHTASVFHIMRVMESTVKQFGQKLEIPINEKMGWHNILEAANKKIASMDHREGFTKKAHAISAHLNNVKVAWRNEVAHPKERYTSNEAFAIINNAKFFIEGLHVFLLEEGNFAENK